MDSSRKKKMGEFSVLGKDSRSLRHTLAGIVSSRAVNSPARPTAAA